MRKKIKLQAVFNIVSIALCMIVIYFLLGSPVLSPETAYKRAEQANLVGPGTILDILEPEGQEYSHLILAKDPYGAMVYAWDPIKPDLREFIYLPSNGSMVFATAPGREYFWLQPTATLPVFLFDDTPDAAAAEISLTIQGVYENTAYHYTYVLSAERQNTGYFGFTIHSRDAIGPEGHALFQLRNATGNSAADMSSTAIGAAVRLLDANGKLLKEEFINL